MKKRIASLLAAIFCLTLLTVPAAAYTRVDTAKPVSLTLNYASEGSAIEGINVRLYKVYAMTDAVRFNPTEEFLKFYGPKTNEEGQTVAGEFQFDVNDEKWQTTDSSGKSHINWQAITETLAALITRDLAAGNAPAPVAAGTSDANGQVVFDRDSQGNLLTAGLYLVIGEPKVDGRYTYTPQTFMTALPLLKSDDTWDYNAIANEKMGTHYDPPGGGGSTTIAITVNKVWDDAGAENVERPASIEVQLLQNGNPYGGTVTLSADNGWYHRWSGLSSSSQWRIAEVDVPEGYTVSVERNTNEFIITNTAEVELDDPDIPEGPAPSTEPDDPGTDIPDIDIPGSDIPDDDIPGGDMPGEPDEPDTDIPDDGTPGGDLPQTGVLWWPVQALTLAGIVFFSIGWLDYRRSKKH